MLENNQLDISRAPETRKRAVSVAFVEVPGY